jgi:hypothetical protein
VNDNITREETAMEDVKIEDVKQPLARREFIGLATAMVAVGVGAALPAATAAAAQGPSTDFTHWLDSIPGKYRQVTDWPDLNNGMGPAYTLTFLNSATVAYGVPESDLGAVLIIRHDTIPIALNDSIWAKYKLGELLKITDPKTKAPALRNPYYLQPGGLPVSPEYAEFLADAALKKLIDRGVKVAACEVALTFWSAVVAEKMELKHKDVKQEWIEAVYPGIQVVPSGTVACNGAVARGCSYMFAG